MLEVRRGDRDDPYDLFWQPPPPLVPRSLRMPVTERILADGTVHAPLALDEHRRRALATVRRPRASTRRDRVPERLRQPGAHELAAERTLRAAGFDGEISLSHQVSGEYREYERT